MSLLRSDFCRSRLPLVQSRCLILPASWRSSPSGARQRRMPLPPPAPQTVRTPAAQELSLSTLEDYSKPRSAFPTFCSLTVPQQLGQPNLGNSPRIDSLMRDGKIYLSIDDAVALALENNLDLDIARYNLNIADTDILRAKSGAKFSASTQASCRTRPAAASAVSAERLAPAPAAPPWPPGGVGTGTNGLVSSTLGIGSPITSFDPVITGTLQIDKNNTESTSVFSPVPILAQNTYTADFAYTQGFQWGTTLHRGIQQHARHHQQSHQPVDSAT